VSAVDIGFGAGNSGSAHAAARDAPLVVGVHRALRQQKASQRRGVRRLVTKPWQLLAELVRRIQHRQCRGGVGRRCAGLGRAT
jgi:hypothetical protein